MYSVDDLIQTDILSFFIGASLQTQRTILHYMIIIIPDSNICIIFTEFWTRKKKTSEQDPETCVTPTWSFIKLLFKEWCLSFKTCPWIIYSLRFWNTIPVWPLSSSLLNPVKVGLNIKPIMCHNAFFLCRKDICHDFNKGLQIPHGGDSYEQIWPGSNPSQFTFDYFKHLYESQVGKVKGKESKDNISVIDDNSFREPSVDSQRNILKEELRMMENSFRDFGKIGFNLIRKSWPASFNFLDIEMFGSHCILINAGIFFNQNLEPKRYGFNCYFDDLIHLQLWYCIANRYME